MTLSRQEGSPASGSRANQKARTRTALVRAAIDLVRAGRSPSMQEAADRALVSVATAYRYFASADDLWWEAAAELLEHEPALAAASERIEEAGDDPAARLEAALRSLGFHMIDDQTPFRRMAKNALDQWFRQTDTSEQERVPVREGRRKDIVRTVVAPLRGHLAEDDVERIAHALTLVIGVESMIALTDGAGLDRAEAKQALLDAGRWLLAGALAELSD
jgi:AcrR family transcriptional regulator